MEAPAARLLALAERRIGELEAIQRLRPPWPEFSTGALGAWPALGELETRGFSLDLAELISLGPVPQPARPTKPLRLAVGIMLTRARLQDEPLEHPLAPLLVTELYQNLDAPAPRIDPGGVRLALPRGRTNPYRLTICAENSLSR